jgi:ribonuclease HII
MAAGGFMTDAGPGLDLERFFWEGGCGFVAGLDEAGRGAWAGPVVAAAVVLPPARPDLMAALDGVRDSKRLAPSRRQALRDLILRTALAAGVGSARHDEIDRCGIVPATRLAMQRALGALGAVQPDALLIDYLSLPETGLPQRHPAKAEDLSLSVAAASILAKVVRDWYMVEIDDAYPGYGFARHKGYGTPEHYAALHRLGPAPIHRMRFRPVRAVVEGWAEQLELEDG